MIFGCDLIVIIMRAQPNLYDIVVVQYAGMVVYLVGQLSNLIDKFDGLREVGKFEFFVQFIFFCFPHRFFGLAQFKDLLVI
jgi:hypothetical protein